jgi:hypothetical protein
MKELFVDLMREHSERKDELNHGTEI